MGSTQGWAARAIGGMYTGAAAVVKTLYRQEALEHELRHLSDSDLADIGIARRQISVVARSHGAPKLLRMMMSRLGIPESVLAENSALSRRLERECITCYARNRCRRWLRSDQRTDDYNRFCPNAAEFEELVSRNA